MARINIEPQFWTDVMEVAARMSDSDKAVGQALKLIKYAQEEYKKGKRISLADFRARFSEHLMPEFARIEGDFVIVAGATKFFGWLDKKKEAGQQGGVKSGKSRRSKTKQTEAKPSTPKQAEPSYSSSISSSSSSSDSSSVSSLVELPSVKPSATDTELNRKIWESYRGAYFSRYGVNPVRNGGVNTKIKGIGEKLGSEAPAVAEFYVMHNKRFYVEALHAIGPLHQDAEGLRTQWATGQTVTQRQAQQTDDASAISAQLQRLRGVK